MIYLTQRSIRRARAGLMIVILLKAAGFGCITISALAICKAAPLGLQAQQADGVLAAGSRVEHKIVGGEVTSFSILREAGQTLRATIEANIELAVVIVRPDGREESHDLSLGLESSSRLILLLNGPPGTYRLNVRPKSPSGAGRCALTLERVDDAAVNTNQPQLRRDEEEVQARIQKKLLLAQLSEIVTRTNEDKAKPLGEQSVLPEDSSARSVVEKFDALRDPSEEDAKLYVKMSGTHRTILARVQQDLPRNTTLLSYYLNTDQPVVFAINNRTIIKRDVPSTYEEVSGTVQDFLGFASTSEMPSRTLEQWYSWLISPVEADLEASNVGIVGDGALQHIPFAAILNGRKIYLGERFNFFYLPRLEMFSILGGRRGKARNRLLVVTPGGITGLSFLENSSREADGIEKLYKVKRLDGPLATKSNFLAVADQYQVIHVIAHAECNKQAPRLSYIAMARDDSKAVSLWVDEVAEMKLRNVELVVLSACETKVCGEYSADAINTLNDAFIAAGAPTVIASLWKVDDKATSLFMGSFYKHLKHAGAAAALAEAQKETRSQYQHPYYWAAFVLTGDPGLLPARGQGR